MKSEKKKKNLLVVTVRTSISQGLQSFIVNKSQKKVISDKRVSKKL